MQNDTITILTKLHLQSVHSIFSLFGFWIYFLSLLEEKIISRKSIIGPVFPFIFCVVISTVDAKENKPWLILGLSGRFLGSCASFS